MDESLDAWAIHGVGGVWGALATGIFASAAINGYSGLLEGNVNQFIANAVGALAAIVYAFGVTFVLATIIDRTLGLRVSEEEEYVGLDPHSTRHSMRKVGKNCAYIKPERFEFVKRALEEKGCNGMTISEVKAEDQKGITLQYGGSMR
jgi:hypothetical protein